MKKRKNALYFRCRKVNWITVKYRHMNRINKWIWAAAMAGISIACQKENVGLYNRGDSMVYFQVQNFSGSNGAEGYTTRTNFSFVDYAAAYTSVVFNAKVKLLGEVKDYDRALKVVVDEERTTMTSYDAVTNPDGGYMMDFDTLKIKAGSNEGTVGVRFMRNASIKKQVDTLVLKLEANQYFEVLNAYKSSNVWSNTTADTIDGTRYTFLISEIYTQPSRWGDVAADQYFGKWNPVRYAYINGFFGFTTTDWTWATGKVSKGRLPFYARELQSELQRRADEGDPVYDEDGSYMQLPDAYHVDYSNVVLKP